MGERLGHHDDNFDDSPAHRFYELRKNEILNEMQQALHETLTDLGGQEALDFLASMHFDLTVEEKKMPTPAMLIEIEQFFPGFWHTVRERWQPLLEEGRILAQVEMRRVRAERDRKILNQYEPVQEFEN